MSINKISQKEGVFLKSELDISTINSHYNKKWVIVDISQRDKYNWPVKGRVILYSDRKEELVEKITTQNIEGDLYMFYCGRIDDPAPASNN